MAIAVGHGPTHVAGASETRPRIISDNGPQFIAKDFKEFIRISGMTHVRTSPFNPQSDGKIERWHKSLKGECIRPGTPLSMDDARRMVDGCVEHYNNVRLNSAIGYITPKDRLAGRQQEIHAKRDRKLEEARKPAANSSAAGRVKNEEAQSPGSRSIG
jgi:transposase InsO family protein